jgi:hypothetical protein
VFEDVAFIATESSNNTIPVSRNEVICIDLAGNILWREFVHHPEGGVLNAGFASLGLVVAKDSTIYIYSNSWAYGGHVKVVVNKFSFDGELLWMKVYGEEDYDVFPTRYGICLNPDSLGITICGILKSSSNEDDIVMYNIDTEGSVTNSMIIDVFEPKVSIVTPILSLPDTSYIIAYNRRTNTEELRICHLVKVENSGEITEVVVNTAPGYVVDAVQYHDENFVLSIQETVGFWEGGLRTTLMSSDFDSIWSNFHNDLEFPYLYVSSSIGLNTDVANNGKVLSVGTNVEDMTILSYSSTGKLLWKREVALEDYDSVIFRNASWTSDGGILIVGSLALPGSCDTFFCSDIFVLKLDSTGCLESNCDDAVVISDVSDLTPHEEGFVLSPTLAFDQIQLSYIGDRESDIIGATAQIIDLMGRVVMSSKITARDNSFNVNSFQPGLYYLIIHNGIRDIYSLPFVKQ